MSALNKYTALIMMSLRKSVQYKYAFITAFLEAAIKISVLYAIWTQAFMNTGAMGGFSREELLTYLFLSQTLMVIYGFTNSPDRLIAQNIRTGDISFDLLKPLRFTAARLFENIGDTLIKVLYAAVLGISLYIIFPAFHAPAGIGFFALFIASTVLSYLIEFSISAIAGFFTFYTMNFWGLHYVKKSVVDFLSGSLIPLALFPLWAQGVLSFLPFKNIIYTPVMIYLGKYDTLQSLVQISVQVIWAVVLWVLAEGVYRSAVRRIEINGG